MWGVAVNFRVKSKRKSDQNAFVNVHAQVLKLVSTSSSVWVHLPVSVEAARHLCSQRVSLRTGWPLWLLLTLMNSLVCYFRFPFACFLSPSTQGFLIWKQVGRRVCAHLEWQGLGGAVVRKDEARSDVQRGRGLSILVAITVVPCEPPGDPEWSVVF